MLNTNTDFEEIEATETEQEAEFDFTACEYPEDLVRGTMEEFHTDAEDAVNYINDRYFGEYESLEDYAYQLLEDTGDLKGNDVLARYFDYEAFTRDLSFDVVVIEGANSVYILSAY